MPVNIPEQKQTAAARTVALVGNPNVGKSVIFGRLTGRYVTVSNYPGTTVDVSRGSGLFTGGAMQVVDTPGILSLFPKSEDERVTRDLLLCERPSAVIQVADAKNLRRSLVVTLEIAALRIPMVLVLNMSDEAGERGIEIDAARLSEILGVPVIEAVATTGEGINEIRRAVSQARTPSVKTHYLTEVSDARGQIAALLPETVESPDGPVPFSGRAFAAETLLYRDLWFLRGCQPKSTLNW
jgi:ferrous iron transport protein B